MSARFKANALYRDRRRGRPAWSPPKLKSTSISSIQVSKKSSLHSFDDMRKHFSGEKQKQMRMKIKNLESVIQDQKRELLVANKKMAKKNDQISQLKEQLQRSGNEIRHLRQKKLENKVLQQKIQELRKDPARKSIEESKDLKREIADLRTQLATARRQLKQQQQQHEKLRLLYVDLKLMLDKKVNQTRNLAIQSRTTQIQIEVEEDIDIGLYDETEESEEYEEQNAGYDSQQQPEGLSEFQWEKQVRDEDQYIKLKKKKTLYSFLDIQEEENEYHE